MTEQREINRWTVVVGALLIQLALGSIYAFSIFTGPLSETLGEAPTSFQILGIFATAIAVFAVTTIFAGRLQDRIGPRVVATLGGLTYGAGYMLAAIWTDNLALLYLTFGIVAGLGLGLGYVCPLAAVVKWFPDKRGLVSGIAVAGFGAGAFIFTQIGKWIISEPTLGLSASFMYLGIIFLTMVIAGAQLLTSPPSDWIPRGYRLSEINSESRIDFEWSDILRTRSYVFLTLMFLLSATAGLMMIGNVGNVAGYLDPTGSMLVVAQFPTIAGMLALFNGVGRIAWGKISDLIGRARTMSIMFFIQAIVLFLAAGFLHIGPSDELIQFIGLTAFASAVGFTFGGNFALFPSTTAEYFGTRNLGMNYGLVFMGYGAAGVLGGLIPGILGGISGGFIWVFIAVGMGSLAAFFMAVAIRPPTRNPTAQPTPAA